MKKVSKNKTIRVLQIGMHDQLGGVEVFLMNYYRHINKKNIQFDFINHCDSLCFSDEIESMGGKIYNVENFKKNVFSYYFKMKKIIKENNYEIVHINLLSCSNILPIIAAKRCKVKKIIVHSHNNGMPDSILKTILHFINKRIITNSANVFWACSDSAGKWMFGNKKYEIIKNGIDINKFIYNETDRLIIRRRLNISESKYVIGHIGRFEIQKNHEFIIDWFDKISKKYSETVLLLVGTGSLFDDINNRVKKLGLEKKVFFVGVVNDPEKYYSAMDMFMLPSKFEGLGIVNVEAQANGLPCMVSDVVPKEVKLSKNFEFINLNDPEKWITIFDNLKNKKINRNLNNEIIKQYDINYLSKELEKKYTTML